jgi:hypothetical protein
MIGFNGGLIGEARDAVANQSVSGVWTLNEQLKAQRDSLWPVPTGPLPTGYKLAMTFNDANGGRLSDSTWTLTSIGTPKTYVSTGGVDGTGYFSNTGRSGVNSDCYRIAQETLLNGANRTYCIWYKGTQTNAAVAYGTGVALFGQTTSANVWGSFGLSNGKCGFTDSGSNYYSSASVNNDTWNQIAFTLTSNRTLKIYVNGLVDSTYSSISINSNNKISEIGGNWPYPGIAAPSAIDGVVVYDRVLTAEEVANVRNAFIGFP